MQPINLHEVHSGSKVTGLVLISSYTKKLDPNSRAPLNGTVTYQGKVLNFKIWDANFQNIFNTNDLVGSIIQVSAEAGVYRDNLELTLTSINFDHGITDKTMFYKSVNIDQVFQSFVDFVNSNLSQQGLVVLTGVFTNENLYDSFKHTWAAMKMHDAQVGGLMNHTQKMLNIAKTLIDNDPRLKEWSDLIYLSIIFHDIGKVDEIGEGGTYTTNSFVGHRTFGVEILTRQKSVIVEAFDETFFYHILEVITGHHGEYGDPPKTMIAFLVHIIDLLDSQATGFLDKVTNNELNERNGQKTVWVNGNNLVI